MHLRWAVPAEMPVDPLVIEGLVRAKDLALNRLARLFQRTLAVAASTEVST